jgi:two-component system, cell cycle sensor histidine kinase and response regulator CckA
MESVWRLAGGVAHDFNNMLGVILGHTELAMNQVDPDSHIHAHLAGIRNTTHRSADLTLQLLSFASKQTILPKVFCLNGTIENMLKMLRRLIGENIDLSWLPGKSLWPVKMDPFRSIRYWPTSVSMPGTQSMAWARY